MTRILLILALLAPPAQAAEAPPAAAPPAEAPPGEAPPGEAPRAAAAPAKAAAPVCQDQQPCPAKAKPAGGWTGKRVNGAVGFR